MRQVSLFGRLASDPGGNPSQPVPLYGLAHFWSWYFWVEGLIAWFGEGKSCSPGFVQLVIGCWKPPSQVERPQPIRGVVVAAAHGRIARPSTLEQAGWSLATSAT